MPWAHDLCASHLCPLPSLLPATPFACSKDKKSLMLSWILVLAVRVEPLCTLDVEQFQVGKCSGHICLSNRVVCLHRNLMGRNAGLGFLVL